MRKRHIDYSLIITSVILVIFGVLMVYSASNVVGLYKYNDEYYFLKRQGLFAGIGLIVMFIIIKLDISKIIKYTNIYFIASLVLLILVTIPGIGLVRGGARSWLGIGPLSIQPSEVIKVSLILFISKIVVKLKEKISKLKYFLLILGIILLVFGLIMLQPDFGTGLVIIISSFMLLFSTGLDIKYFLVLGGLGVVGIMGLIISAPYRMERIFAFLDPWNDPLGSGFQAIQSLFSIAPSGIFGLGFNNSMQKHFFLPEPQNDFIFSIICEELGLIGGVGLILLFLYIIIRILVISTKVENYHYKLILIGISCSIFVQVFINLGVVIGLLPVTGITLPIISYGGTSLIFTLIMLGLVINISKYQEE